MKITNKFNLPETFVSAVSSGFHKPERNGRISVTSLIGPPQIRQLTIDNWDNIEEDCSERVWALLGSAVHSVLEKADTKKQLSEELLRMAVNDYEVVGKPDLLDDAGVLSDYKLTSVWAVIFGKDEWEEQLNVYAALYRKYGFEIRKGCIVAMLRDWNRREAQEASYKGGNYPQCPVVPKEIRIWPSGEIDEYISKRVEMHKAADKGERFYCTDTERWKRKDSFAVKKKGVKKAFRVFDNEHDAINLIGDDKAFELEVRRGEYNRCNLYCPVSRFCPQLADEKMEGK